MFMMVLMMDGYSDDDMQDHCFFLAKEGGGALSADGVLLDYFLISLPLKSSPANSFSNLLRRSRSVDTREFIGCSLVNVSSKLATSISLPT